VSELRWNPLLGEWVATATHRQDRTFLAPEGYCPLCPTKPGGFPTEVPESNYEIVVFENRFPSLRSVPEKPTVIDSDLYPVRPAQGMCEVVLYSPDHASSLAREPVEQIYKLVRIWQLGQSCSTRISSNISQFISDAYARESGIVPAILAVEAYKGVVELQT